MGLTRRDLLKFTGGSAAGLALTPVPWGLLRDTAVLSENWPGVPQPASGEIQTRYTTCALCPAGCGVRARCAGGGVVSLAGVAEHPSSRGVLCTTGLVGHHLAFCRGRATEPLAHGRPAALQAIREAVAGAIAACGKGDPVAILDPRPGRTASLVYRRFLDGMPQGIHCGLPDSQFYGACGIDLENTRTILSFGAPVLDGWISPGRVLANRSHFQLIQVEAAYSRTASLADLWVTLLPGSEEEFAAEVTRALEGNSADAKATAVARMLTRNRPAIAIGGGAATAGLNRMLGSLGSKGGFWPRRDFTPTTDFANLPDGSLRVLIIEEGAAAEPLPWDLVRRKLSPQSPVVVALTPWLDGYARHADYVVPAPMYLESLDEAATPPDSIAGSFSLSPPLLSSPPNLTAPAEFVARLGQDSARYPDLLKQRVADIQKAARGSVFTFPDRKFRRVREKAGDLWKAMLGGAVWLDDPLPARQVAGLRQPMSPAPMVPAPTPEYPLILISAAAPPPHASPLMSKLYRESGLRRPPDAAVVNPETGRNLKLIDGCRATVKSPAGVFAAQVIFDPAVMPGVIQMAGQPVSTAGIEKA